MVAAQSDVRAPSMEKASFEAETGPDMGEEDNGSGAGEMYTPGTFIEIRRNETLTHGVVLGQMVIDSRWHIVSMSPNGELWFPLRDDVMFAVPALVTPELARRCTTRFVVTEEVPLQARIKVLQLMRQVELAVQAAATDIVRKDVNIYGKVRSRNPDEWATTTVTEVARSLYSKPTLVETFATHKYLMGKPQWFVAKHSYKVSQTFNVRPASHVKILDKVTNWSRRQDSPIADFAQRAIPIIAANRKLHHETRDEVPSQRPAKHAWTPEDTTILEFLHHSLRPSRSTQTDPYSLGQSAILRKLDPDGEVSDHQVHMALIDLGVYAPWQDLFSLRRDLDLDQDDPETSPKAQALDALVQRSLSAPAPSGPLGPEDFHPSDPLDHLRHDFGDMPIYVIDDQFAKELDDGFSIEAVPGEPDTHWVHVHIADPTSTIPPTHILAQQAEKRSQSSYFIHRSWPLFPNSLMFSGRPGFSLSQTENRVLTFSSKINAAGELVDSVVRPGIARNFLTMSYDQVDMAVTGKISARSFPLIPTPPLPTMPPLLDWQVADLRTMGKIRARIVQHRLRMGIIDSDNERATITKFVTPKNIESPTMGASEFRGFPEFEYFVAKVTDLERGSRGMVAEAMKIACRTAARWCAERGVQVLYRTGTPIDASFEALQKLLALRDENGYVDVAVITANVFFMPTADYSLTPGAHWSMAAAEGEGYTRATSPLRRFADLLGHYQIQRSLLGQKPYFDTAFLERYRGWVTTDDRLKKRSESLHLRSWVLTALQRSIAAPRTDMLDPLANMRAVLGKPPRSNAVLNERQSEVRIPSLGISATLLDIPEDFEWVISSSIRVKIKEIRLGVRPQLIVCPI
ncbi:hypothetical protein B0H17DRAFT_917772 [Mycena rosella]|uniref:RNB domain-containing protein n=1 Tax=Mycena rosella TaxID=1033263 RepID=A0AAD7MA10_MYCRO|nr:hypothetical protein B0H17DRAFT_917772 [Mycena rosella]